MTAYLCLHSHGLFMECIMCGWEVKRDIIHFIIGPEAHHGTPSPFYMATTIKITGIYDI
jgi:hypothetical protein